MRSKGQLSLDIIFGLVLFIVVITAMQALTLNAYTSQNKTGLMLNSKLTSLGLANAASAGQILNTPGSDVNVNVYVPKPSEGHYFIYDCNTTIGNGIATVNLKYTDGPTENTITQQSTANFTTIDTNQVCKQMINLSG